MDRSIHVFPAVLVGFLSIALAAIDVRADVFNMGPGLTSLEFVPVGDPGNAMDDRFGQPEHGGVADKFRMGKFEVTAAQYTEFLNAVADEDTYGLYQPLMFSLNPAPKIQRSGASPNYSYSVAADRADRPVTFVSFWDAARFANWLHNGQPTGPQGPGTTEDGAYINIGDGFTFARQPGAKFFIPTEDEWYKAAYYDPDSSTYLNYPTGSDSEPENDLSNPLPDPGNNANFYDNGYTIDGPYYYTEVGDFENSASPFGTFDQGGNAYEWTETPGILRGGSWTDGSVALAAYSSFSCDQSCEGGSIGFRVAAFIPEPSTMLLAGMGVLGLFGCARRWEQFTPNQARRGAS